MANATEKQEEVRKFWDGKPCDSELSNKNPREIDFFREIEDERYKLQGHILDVLARVDWCGKKVLEIGTGVGTDARKIIDHGGIYTGINVDRGSTVMTGKALEVFSLPGTVKQCSATSLDFDDASFDTVYSFGVLHHIPDVESAISEIRRVLKPGGELLIMLYNKSSINYYLEIKFLRKLFLRALVLPGVVNLFGLLGFPKEKLARHVELYRASRGMSPQEWLSRNTDGPDNPYSRVYDAVDVERLLTGFEIRSHEVYFFDYRHWGVLGKAMPQSLVNFIGRRWGWHRIVYAVKYQ
jgi:ubiquinone/menaquinone biosynthesis C-methylase UbiE